MLDELSRLAPLIALVAEASSGRAAPDVEDAAAHLTRALVEHRSDRRPDG